MGNLWAGEGDYPCRPEAFGTSPYRFHQMRRLDRARAELKAGTGIAATAHLCGFSDQSHFTRQFKSAFGLAPGRWLAMVNAGERRGYLIANHLSDYPN
jgi:AraC-like DNA-binding protein